MNASTWIAIYLPIFVLLFVILPQQRQIQRFVSLKIKNKRRVISVTNELIKKYINKHCKVYTGSLGATIIGKIIDVTENWMEIETKKGNELVNIDFIQNIKFN